MTSEGNRRFTVLVAKSRLRPPALARQCALLCLLCARLSLVSALTLFNSTLVLFEDPSLYIDKPLFYDLELLLRLGQLCVQCDYVRLSAHKCAVLIAHAERTLCGPLIEPGC